MSDINCALKDCFMHVHVFHVTKYFVNINIFVCKKVYYWYQYSKSRVESEKCLKSFTFVRLDLLHYFYITDSVTSW